MEKALARAVYTFGVGAEMFMPVNSLLFVQQDAKQAYNAVI